MRGPKNAPKAFMAMENMSNKYIGEINILKSEVKTLKEENGTLKEQNKKLMDKLLA